MGRAGTWRAWALLSPLSAFVLLFFVAPFLTFFVYSFWQVSGWNLVQTFTLKNYARVLTDPIYGGVSASLALLGDINIAEPGARAGFAGPNIIEQTIRQKLPPGFQRSEFLIEHGAIDMIVHRAQMRDTVARLLAKLSNQPAVA